MYPQVALPPDAGALPPHLAPQIPTPYLAAAHHTPVAGILG